MTKQEAKPGIVNSGCSGGVLCDCNTLVFCFIFSPYFNNNAECYRVKCFNKTGTPDLMSECQPVSEVSLV